MNNISFSSKFKGTPEVLYVEIHWNKVVYGQPKQNDTYLVTISVEGLQNFTMVAHWLGDMWSCEHLGEVVAWSHFPKPYIPGS